MKKSDIKYHCKCCCKDWKATECKAKELKTFGGTDFVWVALHCPDCGNPVTPPTSEWVGVEDE